MIAIALALAASANQVAVRVPRGMSTCAVAPQSCAGASHDEDATYRIESASAAGPDMKMDAYRVDARPCRLVGNLTCPRRGREVFRLGEPVEQTLGRSFGLN